MLRDASLSPGMWLGGPKAWPGTWCSWITPNPHILSPGWLGGGSVQRPHSGARARFPGRAGWVSCLLQMKGFPNSFPLPPDERQPRGLAGLCRPPWPGRASAGSCMQLQASLDLHLEMPACVFGCHGTNCLIVTVTMSDLCMCVTWITLRDSVCATAVGDFESTCMTQGVCPV